MLNKNASDERSGSSEQGASERSEAAPERKLPRSEPYGISGTAKIAKATPCAVSPAGSRYEANFAHYINIANLHKLPPAKQRRR